MNIKGRWGYINKEGKVAIKASYYEAGFFNFGLAPVRTRRSYRGWGFISHKNKFAIPRWFNNLGNFGEGLAPAAADTRWGFINVRGDWEITPQFEDARSFSEGLAAVKIFAPVSAEISRDFLFFKSFLKRIYFLQCNIAIKNLYILQHNQH